MLAERKGCHYNGNCTSGAISLNDAGRLPVEAGTARHGAIDREMMDMTQDERRIFLIDRLLDERGLGERAPQAVPEQKRLLRVSVKA